MTTLKPFFFIPDVAIVGHFIKKRNAFVLVAGAFSLSPSCKISSQKIHLLGLINSHHLFSLALGCMVFFSNFMR